MKSVLIQLDEPTLEALNQVAPPSDRSRSRFLREAIQRAVFEALEERTRAAYLAQPDTDTEPDDWSEAEEFRR